MNNLAFRNDIIYVKDQVFNVNFRMMSKSPSQETKTTEEADPTKELGNEINKKRKLTKSSQALIERNRQRALLLRESKMKYKPMTHVNLPQLPKAKHGFYSEQQTDAPKPKLVSSSAFDISEGLVNCRECNTECNASFIYAKFKESVCDDCKNKDKDQFTLISKTEAKAEFCLKDCDFDLREPPLLFHSAPNPHAMGVMKLYLKGQVYLRAVEVHGGDDELDAVILKRAQNKEVLAQRKFAKKISDLRKATKVRKPKEQHIHVYGEEKYDEDEDEYSHTCACGHTETYEKM